jgi:D-glycero-D-manno-heptose 1,7-bisphosphate phosphatase
MKQQFAAEGVTIDEFLYCPFHEKGSVTEYARPSLSRKPQPGMVLDAAARLNIDLAESFVVGDKTSDRIRLPYLRSFILRSTYTPEGYDFESIEQLADALLPRA